MMTNDNLSATDISRIGLLACNEKINAASSPEARVFRYPHLDDVFVMESDLYGNSMPKGSCFLAFNGRNGLVGTHILIEKLRQSSVEDIQKLVESNVEG